jgi:hypothetical protein
MKLSSDGGDSGYMKYRRGYGDAYNVVWSSQCLVKVSRSLETGDRIFWCFGQESDFSRRGGVFIFNLLF